VSLEHSGNDASSDFSTAEEFIRARMHVVPLPFVPEVRLYTAHPGSGLRRLVEARDAESSPPYWAYPWAGGTVLARYFLDRPETVVGRRVLDLGAGSGLVGIAAAKAGAGEVIAAEIDHNGIAAIGLNAAENDVAISIVGNDLTPGPPPQVDLIAVGDLYYERDLADRVTRFLDRCLNAGIDVLIGDPGRAHLRRSRLLTLAEYRVPDFGLARDAGIAPSAVYSLVQA